MANTAGIESKESCHRCGTCCRKGGPALHKVDRDLVLRGGLPLKHLFTIRPGELVSNQIKCINEPAFEDIIKIKGSRYNSWSCRYFSPSQNSCGIYADRPLECRILKCWDTRAIESTYQKDRLSRRDLLEPVPGLPDLIEFHQEHCDHWHINDRIEELSHNNPNIRKEAQKEILESLHWDQRLRELAPQKTNINPDQLDLILGRPLYNILKMRGWRIRQEGKDEFCLCAITS